MQRSTQLCWLSISLIHQCTTSWSSTTSTRSRSGLRRALTIALTSAIDRHHQPNLPASRLTLAELNHAAGLQRLKRGEAKPHPGASPSGLPPRAVVDDLEHERAVAAAGADRHRRWPRVPVGVAHRLAQHGLGERL